MFRAEGVARSRSLRIAFEAQKGDRAGEGSPKETREGKGEGRPRKLRREVTGGGQQGTKGVMPAVSLQSLWGVTARGQAQQLRLSCPCRWLRACRAPGTSPALCGLTGPWRGIGAPILLSFSQCRRAASRELSEVWGPGVRIPAAGWPVPRLQRSLGFLEWEGQMGRLTSRPRLGEGCSQPCRCGIRSSRES